MFLAQIKRITVCDQCGNDIYRSQGYRFFDNKLLHDKCFPAYVIETRRKEREAKTRR